MGIFGRAAQGCIKGGGRDAVVQLGRDCLFSMDFLDVHSNKTQGTAMDGLGDKGLVSGNR